MKKDLKRPLIAAQAQKRIRAAAKAGRIEFAEQDRVDQHEDIAEHVLKGMLGVRAWLITDSSSLHDFCPRGLPEKFHADGDAALYAAWDSWVIDEIQRRFGVKIESTDILLCELFEMIESA